MKNRIQRGITLEWTNSTGNLVVSGQVIPLASRIAIAASDISNGKSGSVDTEGVFEIEKTTGESMAFGDELHFDTVTKKLTKTPSATTRYAGMCANSAGAGSSATSVLCKLQSGHFVLADSE